MQAKGEGMAPVLKTGDDHSGALSRAGFKYDVAFSFCDRDRPIAHEVRTLLEPALRVFVYDHEQEAVGGQDGAESFRRVFRDETYLAVILYRNGWGDTRFTGIEEAAIKDRATLTHFRSMLVVMVEPGQTLPTWIPDTTVYQHAWEEPREETAAVIRYRARVAGAVPRVETLVEATKRRVAEQNAAKRREAFLLSIDGAAAVGREVQQLIAEVERQAAELAAEVPQFTCSAERLTRGVRTGAAFATPARQLGIWWVQPIAGSLAGAHLEVVDVPNHHFLMAGRIPGKAWACFDFVLTPAGGHAWQWTADGESSIGETLRGESVPESTAKLATRLLDRLVRYTITP